MLLLVNVFNIKVHKNPDKKVIYWHPKIIFILTALYAYTCNYLMHFIDRLGDIGRIQSFTFYFAIKLKVRFTLMNITYNRKMIWRSSFVISNMTFSIKEKENTHWICQSRIWRNKDHVAQNHRIRKCTWAYCTLLVIN